MPLPERPSLRPHLAFAPEDRDGIHYLIWDQLRLSKAVLKFTTLELEWLRLFDGEHTLREIQAAASAGGKGPLIPLEVFEQLANALDQALFLDGPDYQKLADNPVRSSSCFHHYETSPGALCQLVEDLFTGPQGPGLPRASDPDGRLRAALIPHMDYHRGGSSFAWAFKEVFEGTPASLFVIIGTSHYSRHRFTLTRKHFQTPLGIAPTDQVYIDRLVEHYGPGLFDDELLAHLPEHSIELEVVFLQYYYANRRPFRIVPLVVGSFGDCVASGRQPSEMDDIGRMIHALRAVEAETPEPICYLISGDLAHLGPKFGDHQPVHDRQLAHSRAQDQALLRLTEQADPGGYFQAIAAEGDRRRICGLPPTYTVLEAVRPTSGKVLAYKQYVDPDRHESVSFASVAFYR